MKKLLTYKTVAEMLDVKVNTIYWWVHTNRIPHVRLGPRCVRFESDAIVDWLAKHRSTLDLMSAAVHDGT